MNGLWLDHVDRGKLFGTQREFNGIAHHCSFASLYGRSPLLLIVIKN